MVTPARFERTTCPLGGDRSIQLSYGAIRLSGHLSEALCYFCADALAHSITGSVLPNGAGQALLRRHAG